MKTLVNLKSLTLYDIYSNSDSIKNIFSHLQNLEELKLNNYTLKNIVDLLRINNMKKLISFTLKLDQNISND
jgi:hypothetical protein